MSLWEREPYSSVIIPPDKLRYLAGQIDQTVLESYQKSIQRWEAFQQLGFSQEDLAQLEQVLLSVLNEGEVTRAWESEYGEHLNVEATITGPNGRKGRLITGWLRRSEAEVLEFITAFLKVFR